MAVNVRKLRRVLYKEFTKSPLKTGFLVAMCPVAVYFVLPLCLPGKDKPTRQSNRPLELTTSTQEQTTETVEVDNNWAQLTATMTNDPWMVSAELPAAARDPFKRLIDEPEEREVPDDEPDKIASEQELVETYSIALTATMVTPRTRIATINGKTYREQELLELDDRGNGIQDQTVRLAEVGPRHAILDWEGKSIRLDLQRSQSGRIRIAPVKEDGD